MIKSIKFTSGYPVDLINEYTNKPTFKDKVIEFSDGINVLFAPNGYGKSTILNAISIYGLTKGGWSNLTFKMMDFNSFLLEENVKDKYNIDQLSLAEHKFSAKIDIDGPVYNLVGIKEEQFSDYASGFGEGMLSSTQALVQKMYRSQRSSGYINMYEQGANLINLMENYEEYKFNPESLVSAYEKDKDSLNEYRKEMIISLYDYAKKTVLKGGKPTLVMDEPELHLDLDHTLGLYTNIIPKLAEHFQIIISSHFCLLPFFKEYHFLPLGYDTPKVKDYIKNLIKTEE
jgi:predicted ATPase